MSIINIITKNDDCLSKLILTMGHDCLPFYVRTEKDYKEIKNKDIGWVYPIFFSDFNTTVKKLKNIHKNNPGNLIIVITKEKEDDIVKFSNISYEINEVLE